ncbi:MAG: ribonuclease III, partial [Actinotalea sp.]|nr:ribonuclease III [Actinotalea sp.]
MTEPATQLVEKLGVHRDPERLVRARTPRAVAHEA